MNDIDTAIISELIEIKLNLYIFQQLSYYLSTLDNSKERLLELSLLSKSCFKIFQKIITSYDFNRNKFILSLSQFINYIKSSIPITITATNNKINTNTNTKNITNNDTNKNNNDNKYQYKLIQYKDIERIKVSGIPKECLSLLYISDNNNIDANKLIHSFLKSNCNQLKKVVLLDEIHCFPKINYDFTCNSFFKVKKLSMIWTKSNPPISINETVYSPITGYPFSFNFLLKYNPSKLIIGTGEAQCEVEKEKEDFDKNLYLHKIENILNCKSIKSIKFRNHEISTEFFKLIINASPNTHAIIQSLSICGFRDYGRSITDDIIHRLKESNFATNTTLKKLIIESMDDPEYDSYWTVDEVNPLLEIIKQNKSLNTFGLFGFNIYGDKELEQLNEIHNLTKFIITDPSLKSLKPILKNTTLKKLHLIKYKYSNDKDNLNLISDFLNNDNNISQLKPSSLIYTNIKGISKPYSDIINGI